MLSVAMTTREGAAFIEAQVESLDAQLAGPDELVIGDDASTDATVELLEQLGRGLRFPVLIHRNPTALGVVGNVESVLGRVSGDLVALADQDDVWRADKLSRLVGRQAATGAALVFSDGHLIDEHGRPTGKRLWPALDVTPSQIEALVEHPPGPLLRHSVVSGCTMLVTRSVIDLALPFPPELADPRGPMLHDRWLALVAACCGPVAVDREPLVGYRQHDAQRTGANRDSRLHQLREQATSGVEGVRQVAAARSDQIAALVGRFVERQVEVAPPIRQQLFDALAHHRARAALPGPRRERLPVIYDEVRRGGYQRWTRGITTAVVDVLRDGKA